MYKAKSLYSAFVVVVFAVVPAIAQKKPEPTATSRWATFTDASGASYFALSLQATGDLPVSDQVEVAVIVDTSASQTGPVRLESLEVLDELAASLPLNSKIALLACDVKTDDLSGGLVTATDSKFEFAVKKLKKRIPLGTSNLGLALRTALGVFSKSEAQRTIVYIGDGVNRSQLLSSEQHSALIGELVERQVTVSSLGIGPVVDVVNLAALANNTGGIFLSRNEIQDSTQAIGQTLATSVATAVVWPTRVDAPKALQTFLPTKMPPLRLDRDSVVIGQSTVAAEAGEVKVQGMAGGKNVELVWKVTPEVSNPDLGFLPSVIESAKADGGISMPALGSAGLRAMSLALADTSTELVKAGQFALKSGDADGAKRIAEEALKSDPNNAEAITLLNAAVKAIEAGAADKP